MGIESRKGNLYYYRKRREGERVIPEYVGGGLAGGEALAFEMSAFLAGGRCMVRTSEVLLRLLHF